MGMHTTATIIGAPLPIRFQTVFLASRRPLVKCPLCPLRLSAVSVISTVRLDRPRLLQHRYDQDPDPGEALEAVHQPLTCHTEIIAGCRKSEVLGPAFDPQQLSYLEPAFLRQPCDCLSGIRPIVRLESVHFISSAELVKNLVKRSRGELGNQRYVVKPVRCLRQKRTARLKDTQDFPEDSFRVGQMLEDIVGKNDVECLFGPRDRLTGTHLRFVEVRIAQNGHPRIEAADLSSRSAEIHLFHKTGTGSQIENQRVLADMSKNDLPKNSVIPMVGIVRIEPRV